MKQEAHTSSPSFIYIFILGYLTEVSLLSNKECEVNSALQIEKVGWNLEMQFFFLFFIDCWKKKINHGVDFGFRFNILLTQLITC